MNKFISDDNKSMDLYYNVYKYFFCICFHFFESDSMSIEENIKLSNLYAIELTRHFIKFTNE